MTQAGDDKQQGCDEALTQVVSHAKADAWATENAEAILKRRAWIRAHGTLLADLQILRIG